MLLLTVWNFLFELHLKGVITSKTVMLTSFTTQMNSNETVPMVTLRNQFPTDRLACVFFGCTSGWKTICDTSVGSRDKVAGFNIPWESKCKDH